MISFGVKDLFNNFASEIDIKINLRIIRKNYSADPEIRFPTKSTLEQFENTRPFRQLGN